HATPGGPNDVGSAAGAPPPQISLRGGVFTNAISVVLSAAAPMSQIRYTLNGSRPTASSPLYTGPITASNSMVLRAAVFLDGFLPSAVVTESYTIVGSELFTFSSPLPIIIINSLGQGISPDVRVPASFTAIETYRGRSA